MVDNMHRENIQYIINNGTPAQMEELKDVVIDVIHELKTIDHDRYVEVEYEIAKIAYHGHVSETLAKCWVGKMKNKDGSTGEHWTMDQVSSVLKDKNIKHHLCDFYVVLNMMYSDFYNSRFDTVTYIEMAKDWLDDKDVDGCKLLKYYYFVVK
jgi:hypothetical protein